MRTKLFYALVTLIALASCNAHIRERSASAEQANMTADTVAAVLGDTVISIERKLIKTADLKCRVDNVLEATRQAEKLVKDLGGMVEESHLQNNWSFTEEVYYKPDSVKVVNTYSPVSHLTLRVPGNNIDSVVNTISSISSFVETRNLGQQDATMQYLGNTMKNQLAKTAEKAKEGKVADASYNNIKTEEVIYRELENLQLQNKVQYSTLNNEFYQHTYTKAEIKVDPDFIRSVPYSLQLVNALDKSWYLLKMLLLAVVFVWPLWLSGIAIAVFYRYRRRIAFSRK